MLFEFVNSDGDIRTLDTKYEIIYGGNKEDFRIFFEVLGNDKKSYKETLDFFGSNLNDNPIAMIKDKGYFTVYGVKYIMTEESKQEFEMLMKNSKQKPNNIFLTLVSLVFSFPLLLLIIL